MHVLIAPNAFKHSLDAESVARAIEGGLRRSRLGCTTERFPVADGGDGTAALLVQRLRGHWVTSRVCDPLGRSIAARFGLIESGRVAIIEVAEASGLRRLRAAELDPLRASSFGTGELVRSAIEHGAREIVLAAGGSATVDGGAGLLNALGVRFRDRHGRLLRPAPAALERLRHIDLTRLEPRARDCRFTVLCDVTSPLLGPRGAAAVFGPQKGASPAMVARLEARLSRWSEVLARHCGIRVHAVARGGSAGGIAAGLRAMLDATLVSGIEYFLDATHFDAALTRSTLVITGEGCLDSQTLRGKAPDGVARRAHARSVPVIALAGSVPLTAPSALHRRFDALVGIAPGPMSLAQAIQSTADNLTRSARELGDLLALAGGRG